MTPSQVEVLREAERVFANVAKARAWLERPCSALAGRAPLDATGTPEGIQAVRELLVQLDDGMFG